MNPLSLLFLSQTELQELTDLKMHSAQIRWLQKHAYPFEVSAVGKPKVLRSLVMERLKSFSVGSSKNEPNFDAIR